MSKLDVGVGEEFPLDEGRHPRGHRRHGHHRHDFRRHHHGRHHHHHHGVGRLAFLLVLGGIVALIVTHQVTAPMAFGLIGVGIALMLVRGLLHLIWHWRHRRAVPSQAA